MKKYITKIISEIEDYAPLVKIIELIDKNFLIYDGRSNFIAEINKLDLKKMHALLSNSEAAIQHNVSIFHAFQKRRVFCGGILENRMCIDDSKLKKILINWANTIYNRKFVLEVTQDCNRRCNYCPYTNETKNRRHQKKSMTLEIAKKAIDNYFSRFTDLVNKTGSVREDIAKEFLSPNLNWYGGEPFLEFKLIEDSLKYFTSLKWPKLRDDQNYRFSITSNFTICNNKIIDFLIKNKVYLFISFDGPKVEHDRNRVFCNGEGSHEIVFRHILLLHNADPDYFKKYVTIQAVNSLGTKILNSEKYLNSLFGKNSPYEAMLVNILDYTSKSEFFPNAISRSLKIQKDWKNKISRFIDSIKDVKDLSLSELKTEHIQLYQEIQDLFSYDKITIDNPYGKDHFDNIAACPIGFDNLLVDYKGRYHICNKTDGTISIGDVYDGFNQQKMLDILKNFSLIFNDERCRKCWNHAFCNICPAVSLRDGIFHLPTEIECDYLKTVTESMIRKFFYLSEDVDFYNKIKSESLKEAFLSSQLITIFKIQNHEKENFAN